MAGSERNLALEATNYTGIGRVPQSFIRAAGRGPPMTADDSDRVPDDGEDVEVRIVDEPGAGGGEFDRRLTDLLGRLLDTETRGKVYVHVLRDPGATSEAIARGTGLYPETVRRTVADLRSEGVLDRREIEGEEGRYGYTAVPPIDLAGRLLGGLQTGLDAILDPGIDSGGDVEPVTIDVKDAASRREGEDDDEGDESGHDDAPFGDR